MLRSQKWQFVNFVLVHVHDLDLIELLFLQLFKYISIFKDLDLWKKYISDRIWVCGWIFLGFLSAFWPRRIFFLNLLHLLIKFKTLVFRLPIDLIFALYESEHVSNWRRDYLGTANCFQSLFIWAPINRLITFEIISLGFCLYWLLRVFVVFEKWSSLVIVVFNNHLRVCVSFAFCLDFSCKVKIGYFFIDNALHCLDPLFLTWDASSGSVFGRMISLLHPSVAFIAIHPKFAPSSLNGLDFIWKIPEFASYGVIVILFGVSPKILNVMCIGTFIPLMTEISIKILLRKWTPNSLVLIDVKIIVFLKQMNQFDVLNDLILSMGKWAKAFVITILDIIGIKLTKFSFVTIWMIKLLKFVMRKLTVLVVAFLFLAIKVTIYDVWGSSFILIVVIINACFAFVHIFDYWKIYSFYSISMS